jgi:hypothetical protein
MKLMNKVTEDIEETIIKQSDIILKGGRCIKIGETFKKSDIAGIVLKSGKIISLKFHQSPFSESQLTDYPSSRFIEDINKAKQEMEGFENTNILALSCYESGLSILDRLGENEYIPSVGELSEAFSEFNRINQIRKALGLEPLPVGYYWSSTIRNRESMWVVFSDGDTLWRYWYDYYGNYDYVLAFLRK